MALFARSRPHEALTASAALETPEPPAPVRLRARFGRPARALTAAAAKGSDPRAGLQRLDQAWQRQAMLYYRTVGECWFPAQFFTRAQKRVRFYPAIKDEKDEPQEVTSGPLVEIFRQIQDPGGGINQIAATYGQLRFLIGDGYLIASDDSGSELWEYLSPMELRLQPNTKADGRREYRRIRAPGITPEELVEAPDDEFAPLTGNNVRVWRLWNRNPEFSSQADSPIMPVLEIYELLARLTLAAGARASSRAAQQGAFYMPDELSYGPADKTQDEDATQDLLMQMLIDVYVRGLKDPGDVGSMMPALIRGPAVLNTGGGSIPMKDLMGLIPLNSADGYPEADTWEKVIDRLAGSLDLPREMVAPSGMGNTNHWSGWLLDEQGFRQYQAPNIIDFCSDITSAYLKPAAIVEGLRDADRVMLWFDPSEAINHPDQIGTAFKAFDRVLISEAATREATGYTENDAPDEEEYARRVEIMLKTIPPDVAADAGETTPAAGGSGGDATKQPPAAPSQEPPPDGPPEQRGPTTASAAVSAATIAGAAMMQIDRARERVGNQLRRRSQGCADCQRMIRDVAPALVASALGAETVRGVIDGHVTEASLVADSHGLFAARLRQWGINGDWPERLSSMVEQHALRTLYEAEVPPLPPGFIASCERAVA